MTIGQAIEAMKKGEKVARAGWNGRNMWLAYQPPQPAERKLPYIYMSTVQGELVPWLASQTDLLADDWAVVIP